jgi:hypothetical protein
MTTVAQRRELSKADGSVYGKCALTSTRLAQLRGGGGRGGPRRSGWRGLVGYGAVASALGHGGACGGACSSEKAAREEEREGNGKTD